MDTSRNTHYSSYPYGQSRPTGETVPPPSKEIYQYDAPWLTYALDWCKTPIEQKSFRLAVGSFIEDSNNKVSIWHLVCHPPPLTLFGSCKLFHVRIYLITGYL